MKKVYRINEQLKNCSVISIVGELYPGDYSYNQAQNFADDLGLDLVEVSKKDDKSICKIMDYQKFLYQQKKKEKENKSKSTKTEVKEIQFGPQTGKHDYDFKLEQAKKFLNKGNKVKAVVSFKGRELSHKELGEALLKVFIQDLNEFSQVEAPITLNNRKMITVLSPKHK